MALIELVCWTCDGAFTMQRRRGQYPQHCPGCRTSARAARRLAARARRQGLGAWAVLDPDHGWIVRVQDGMHDDPVLIRTDEDLRWIVHELEYRGLQVAA